jgi:hypothetical protein
MIDYSWFEFFNSQLKITKAAWTSHSGPKGVRRLPRTLISAFFFPSPPVHLKCVKSISCGKNPRAFSG